MNCRPCQARPVQASPPSLQPLLLLLLLLQLQLLLVPQALLLLMLYLLMAIERERVAVLPKVKNTLQPLSEFFYAKPCQGSKVSRQECTRMKPFHRDEDRMKVARC